MPPKQPATTFAIPCPRDSRFLSLPVSVSSSTIELKRMEAGTYGTCVICGEPVAFERLLVFPEAPNCAGCAGR
jgi:hypothetical protein